MTSSLIRTEFFVAALVVAIARGGCGPPPSPAPPPPAPQPIVVKRGVEVGWIAREPRLAAPETIDTPAKAGWPEDGRIVHWIAHVINRTGAPLPAVSYAWHIGGETLGGVVDLPPGRTEVLLARRWTFTRELITFAVTPPPEAADASTDDNQVTVDSGALSLIFTVEQGLYDWMLQQERPGFEAFAQREVERWNAILARAIHALSPQGALDRIRIDEVRLLPDGTALRGEDFMLWDLHWSFRTIGSGTQFLSRGVDERVWVDQTIVLHELMHQRGLTDLYDYDVWHRFGVAEVGIMEGARAVAGSFLMPAAAQTTDRMLLYAFPVPGLMRREYRASTNLTAHSTFGLNLWAGRRTPVHLDRFGNRINDLTVHTLSRSYLGRLPRETALTFVDADGAPVADPEVDVYLDQHPHTYHKAYTAEPTRTLARTPGRGALLPGDILEGMPPAATPAKSQVIILRVRTPQARGYAFLPVYYLNLLHFEGHHEQAALEIPVVMHRW
jgi:hypothetical protein